MWQKGKTSFFKFLIVLNSDNSFICSNFKVWGFNLCFDRFLSLLKNVIITSPCVLTHRSSMLPSPWLRGHRAKLLRTTWMSSKTSGKSRSECWLRLWMTSPQWMTSSLSQVVTCRSLTRELEGADKIRNISAMIWVCDLRPVFGLWVFNHPSKCDYNMLLKKFLSQDTESGHLREKL